MYIYIYICVCVCVRVRVHLHLAVARAVNNLEIPEMSIQNVCVCVCTYICHGVATINRLLKIIGLFCRISSLL